ncbi:hypothetical protein PCANB_002449 [Pneumocystis canis]|nr:hypothetical protein PCANB_002449 [Pneumocystis canis]
MAFHFSWNKEFSPSFIAKACFLLSYALNKGKKLPIIVDKIDVKELNMGSIPPELEILEIGDLAEDRFRGLFKLKYSGDAYIINPLNTHKKTSPRFTWRGVLAADAPLIVPMFLRLSDFKLSSIIILVFSKAKGITLVFRNDPVESVRVSSTFDSIPVVAQFLQKEIEKQLRTFFQEELPAIIHKLSLSISSCLTDEKTESPSNIILTDETSKTEELAPIIRLADINPEHPISITGMLRLSALASSQKTLSPFTPSINQAIYRSSHLLSTVFSVNHNIKPHLPNNSDFDSTTLLTSVQPTTHTIELQNTRQNLSLRQISLLNKRWTQKKHNVIRLHSDSKNTLHNVHEVQPLLEKDNNMHDNLHIKPINTFHNIKKKKRKNQTNTS